MHTIVTTMTAIVLFVHALVGCGGHTLHACAECHESATPAVHALTCCDHDHGTPSPSSPSTPPCGCQFECHKLCVSLPPQKTQLDDSQQWWSVELLVTDGPSIGSQFDAGGAWEILRRHSIAEPPLALHLLHQILLI